ncbi:OB-fold domain-containing protein [Microbacteriaceae bacterium K1510]|nr:OB-fold domain-containing protein [Microbacteriaceae bacterium K1510]
MSDIGKMAINADAASADPRFVAPELVRVDAVGKPHLVGGRCRTCGALSFPRAAVCTSCLSEDIEAVSLGDEGALYSYSVVHQAPKGWLTPYALGYVDLSDGVRVLAHIDVPHDAIEMDMRVKLGIGVVGADPSGAPLYSYTFGRP